MNLTSIVTVAFVWFLMCCLILSYGALYLPALYQQNFLWFVITTSITCVSLIIGAYSYLMAIWTSPGYPDPNLKQYYAEKIDDLKRRADQQKQFKQLRKQQKLTNDIKLRQIKMLVEHSYCKKCDNVKLSRVHHCSQCKTCIERMDHHCPWVGNCVGKYNHKFFLLFLFYITIALIVVSVSILIDYVSGQQPVLSRIEKIDDIYYIAMLATGGMCILLLFAIGFLFIGQTTLLFQNLTTLESFYDEIFNHNPFEKQSLKDHFRQVFGESLWFLPTKPFPGHVDQVNVAFVN